MKLVTILLCAVFACLSSAATPDEWRSRSIYFVVTDRFARTDGSLTAPCNLADRLYCGGSWQGLINKLDYIKNMGFTAVWITPVTHNIEGVTGSGTAFHGYWQDDIYSLNEHYGSEADLKALAKALHDRDMYFMVDVVANHFAFEGMSQDVKYEVYRPFNSSKYFHRPCDIDFNRQESVEDCWIGYNTAVELTDLDTTRQDVKELYYDWIKALVEKYSIDGLRVDTVKHVQKDFWPGFNAASGVYNVGEVFAGGPEFLCDYQNYMDGLLNYALYYPLKEAFRSTSGNIQNLVNSVNDVKRICKDSTLMGTFIENHDNERFPFRNDDLAQAKNVIAFTILADGIPILYYGQEQHLGGDNDPFNRQALWLTEYKTDDAAAPLYNFIAKVNQIRNTAISKDRGYLNYKAWPVYSDTTTIALRKGFDGGSILAVFSNKGSFGDAYTQVIRDNTGFFANQEVVEILSCERQRTDQHGAVTVHMGRGEPKIFYPVDKLTGTGICGISSGLTKEL